MSDRFIINAVHEYNEHGHLFYSEDFTGAFVRGKTIAEALAKFPREIISYLTWIDEYAELTQTVVVIKEAYGDVSGVEDADSYVLFQKERQPLVRDEYEYLKFLALKSAADFKALYDSVPDKNAANKGCRKTFYGKVPRTAEEMYLHTANVNSYYFGEIDVLAGNEPDIYEARRLGFEALETTPCYLDNPVFHGSYNEDWSLRKLIRRFIWHDRIHAKAMYRMAKELFGRSCIKDPFCFDFDI